jgi:phosphate transport system permease protein
MTTTELPEETTAEVDRIEDDGAAQDSAVSDGASEGGAPTPPAVPTEAEDRPRPLVRRTLDDRLSFVGAGLGSLALVWLIYYHVLPFSGALGFFVVWYLAFVAMYLTVTAMAHPWQETIDRLMTTVMYAAALVVGAALAWTLSFIFVKGYHAVFHWNFFTQDMAGVRPDDSLSHGGIAHAVVGSMIMLAIAVAISLPLGIGTAVFLTEVGGRFGVIVRTIVEAMTAVPDLLAGLFVYVFLIIELGQEKNGLAAAIAMSVTMTPIIARSAEVALRVVPGGLREAGMALGASQWATVRRVVLPTARPGLATAMILAMARGIGETAPLLIVSGASTYFNKDPLHLPMNSLPLFIYTGARSGVPNYISRAYGAAAVLLAIVFVLFVITRFLARQRDDRR